MKIKSLTQKLSLVFVGLIASSSLIFADDGLHSNIIEELESSLINQELGHVIAQKTTKKKTSNYKKPRQPRQEVVNSWKPFWIMNRYIEPTRSYFFSTDLGCGFLYFSNVTANLQDTSAAAIGFVGPNNSTGNLQGKVGYNRTPVIETMLGVKVWNWFGFALSYLHQGGINIQTNRQYYGPVINGSNVVGFVLKANLALDAILAKVYFNLPGSVVFKTVAYNPYLGVAAGPGWQTWSHIVDNSNLDNDAAQLGQDNQIFKQKISANAVWMIDLGVKLRSVLPNLGFSVKLGTKFVGWGQARNIGLASQQKNTVTYGLLTPFKVQFVYSFAPYMGIQWNF